MSYHHPNHQRPPLMQLQLQPQQQPVIPVVPVVPRKRQSSKRKTRTNEEWREDLKQIYGSILRSRLDGNMGATLRSYCYGTVGMVPQYTRISAVWKELGLEEFLSREVPPVNRALIERIDAKFPVAIIEQHEGYDNEKVGRDRRHSKKNEKRTSAAWRKLLSEVYHFLYGAKTSDVARSETVRSYCRDVLKSEQQYRRIIDFWTKLRLDKDLENGVLPTDSSLKEKLATQFLDVQLLSRDLRPSSNSYFDNNEEDALREFVAACARTGFPVEKTTLKEAADAFLEADGIGAGINSIGGISDDTVSRIYKEGRIKAKTNANPIDPKRASQADPQVLNCLYHQADAWVKMAHEINPDVWPECRYPDIPPHRIYNTD
eukprot:Sro1005_g230200.2  (373) ;mRNA; f:7521-8641